MYPVHFHKRKVNKESHLLLLFIPSIIFSLIVTIYVLNIRKNYKNQVATVSNPQILGEENEAVGIDKQ